MTNAPKRITAATLLLAFTGGAWYLGQPRVPAGQLPLVTLEAASSIAPLREAFNRDASHIRVIVLPSPT